MDYLFQEEQYRTEDQARLDAWRADEWSFIGIHALALLTFIRNGTATTAEIESAGLWGIESDSNQEYLDSVFKEECDELCAMLGQFENGYTVQ